MPISGTFLADFASFTEACAQAEVSLKGFEAGSGKVETALNRMTNSLSGTKIIQDATLMAEAVERVGGTSTLTEAELKRVGATATEAANKLRAMGQDVPPGIQKIADEAKNADTAHKGLGSTVKDLALGFAAMFTARAAFNFVKSTIDEASALKDLSQQTHIGVEELQILAGGMSEFGVDADELGKGLYKLSRGIAGGDESVTRGLHLMGLSLKDVEGLNGKELFLKIEAGLATLQGGLRDTAAADLFGGKLGAAMAGASEGIEGTLDTWQRLNHVASTDSVDAMDQFGESIERANKNVSSIAANMIGPLAQGFNVLFDAATKGASKWDLILGLLPKGLGLVGTGTEGLATAIDHANAKMAEQEAASKMVAGAHANVTAAVDTRTAAEKFMAALEADSAKALSSAQLDNLAHLKDIGALNAQNAAGIGVNAAQFAKYTAEMERAKKAAADAAVEAKKFAAAVEEVNSVGKTWQETIDTINGDVVEQMRVLNAAGVSMSTLATYYGLTTSQGAAFTAMLASEAAALKLQESQIAATEVLWDQYYASINEASHNTTQAQIDNVWLAADAQIAAMEKAKTITLSGYDAIWAKALQTAQNIEAKALEGDVNSKSHYQKLADDARIAYEFALAHATEYTDKHLQQLRDEADTAAMTMLDWQAAADHSLTAVKGSAEQATAALKATTAAVAMVGGGSGVVYAGAVHTGGYGYTDAEWAMINAGFGANIMPHNQQPGGGLVHMDKGGPILQDGPIYAHAGEYVVPKGGMGGPGVVVNNVFHLVDTESNLTRRIADNIARSVRQGRKLASA